MLEEQKSKKDIRIGILKFDIRRQDYRKKPALDLNLQTHSLALDVESKFGGSSNFKAGVSGRYQKNFPDPATGVKLSLIHI